MRFVWFVAMSWFSTKNKVFTVIFRWKIFVGVKERLVRISFYRGKEGGGKNSKGGRI